jgi:hypothetical protein
MKMLDIQESHPNQSLVRIAKNPKTHKQPTVNPNFSNIEELSEERAKIDLENYRKQNNFELNKNRVSFYFPYILLGFTAFVDFCVMLAWAMTGNSYLLTIGTGISTFIAGLFTGKYSTGKALK